MHKFEPPDSYFFSAAVGWLELGNPGEAKSELARLAPALQDRPEVLELRWLICAEEKNWEEGLRAAEALVRVAPEISSGWLHRAYALRRIPGGSLQSAWDALLPAAAKFPDEALIPFNLACYACQMQQLDTALSWLKCAVAIGGKSAIKQMALEDPDLQPLLKQIEEL
jgi:hypothetical protein